MTEENAINLATELKLHKEVFYTNLQKQIVQGIRKTFSKSEYDDTIAKLNSAKSKNTTKTLYEYYLLKHYKRYKNRYASNNNNLI